MDIVFESAKKAPTASDVVNSVVIALSPVAKERLRAGQRRGEYLQTLINEKLYQDAITFLAFALPRRCAVWWGCLVLSDLLASEAPSETELNALQASIAWVIEPEAERARAASRWGSRCPSKSPFCWLARAAGYLDLPLPAAMDHLPQNFPARGVATSISVALALDACRDGEEDEASLRVLALGWDVSRGRSGWPTTPAGDG
ncbi:hypothetical protein Pan216_13110 [Planctomycetes bacterium Pan216]|uniref:Uncharacterized protein n=1 Tax=Kolteria novifilia TaxID=2527975 RepID=A0A518B0H2_9BACT|nr:hypothetical protein Pan216_13110 [Planctomycetes bacterium Pan216]